MIFAFKGYKDITLEDLKDWDEWVHYINEDYKYCQTIENIFEFEGLCDPWHLSSDHPYWDYQVLKSTKKLLSQTKGLKGQLEKLLEVNPYHRYAHNITWSISNYEKTIKELTIEVDIKKELFNKWSKQEKELLKIL